jgi:hypothetical protein
MRGDRTGPQPKCQGDHITVWPNVIFYPVVSENSIRGSRGGPMVVLEEPAEAIGHLNGTITLRQWPDRDLVPQTLVASLPVIVCHVLAEGSL